MCLSVCLSVCIYVCLSVSLSVCLSVYMSFNQSIYLSFCLPICSSACLPACLPACLCVCFSVQLPASLSSHVVPLNSYRYYRRLDPTDGIHPARQDRLYSRVRYPLEGKVRHLDIFARSEQHHGAFKHCLALRNRIDPLRTALQFCRKPSPNLTLIPSVPTTGMRS